MTQIQALQIQQLINNALASAILALPPGPPGPAGPAGAAGDAAGGAIIPFGSGLAPVPLVSALADGLGTETALAFGINAPIVGAALGTPINLQYRIKNLLNDFEIRNTLSLRF